MVITTSQLHSIKPEVRLYAGSNPACSVSEIHYGENLRQWSWLGIRLNTFFWSTIPQKQFIIIIIVSNQVRIFNQCPTSIPPTNIRKPSVFYAFRGNRTGILLANGLITASWILYLWRYFPHATSFRETKKCKQNWK